MQKRVFDPNGAAHIDSGIFGLPCSIDNAQLILLTLPWDATASYGSNASNGPSSIFDSSKYVELYDINLGNFYERGISMEDIPPQIQKLNRTAKNLASLIIKQGGTNGKLKLQEAASKTDELCKKMNNHTYDKTLEYLNKNRLVGLIGGDHSVSLGCIKAHLEKFPELGVLQIDAHCDLREKFEDLTYSHASVMFNLLKETHLKKLVQVGVRGLCEEEYERIRNSGGRIQTFFDASLQESKHQGKTWDQLCDGILAALPKEIYLSVDIDGLDPSLCPHTGTPIPGGLSYSEIITLIKKIVESGTRILGFDLVEVAPGEDDGWDAVVGAHLLYQLCGWSLRSRK